MTEELKQIITDFFGGGREEWNERNLNRFKEIAFKHVPVTEIFISLKGNPEKWNKVYCEKGFRENRKCPDAVMSAANNNGQNIIYLLVSVKQKQIALMQELYEFADFFEAEDMLPDHSILVCLYFVKRSY